MPRSRRSACSAVSGGESGLFHFQFGKLGFEDRRDLRSKFAHVDGGCIPDDAPLNGEVLMNGEVAESSRVFPRHIWVAALELVRDAVRRFSDFRESLQDRATHDTIVKKPLTLVSNQKLGNVGCREGHIAEIQFVSSHIAGQPHPGWACG